MRTAVTIPVATECLKLDLIEGGWLCKKQEIVKGTGLAGPGSSVPGARPH